MKIIMDTNQGKNKIEYFRGKFLHPSLDIKGNILIFGFRYFANKTKEENVFLVVKKENPEVFTGEDFEFEGKQYFIEANGRKLARIEEKWSLGELEQLSKDFRNLSLTGKDLFGEIKKLAKKYGELEKEIDYSLITAFSIGTYFYPIFSKYPFLHLKAVKSSGKSQWLNFLNQICFNAIKSRPTLASLGDTVDSLRGTCLFDQADFLNRKGNEDLVDILADSYKRGGGKRRIVERDKYRGRYILELDAYSPKVFASRKDLPEDLRDRCIAIPLYKSSKNFPEPDDDNEDWKKIRGECYKFSICNFGEMKTRCIVKEIEYRQTQKIIGRELDLWFPFEIILEKCAPNEIEETRRRFKQLYGYTEFEPSELEKMVIEAIYQSFEEESSILLRPQDIREKFGGEVWEDKFLNDHQKDIRIGYIIRDFNLSSEKKKNNKGVIYLFEKEKVLRIRTPYCQNTENTANSSSLEENPKNLTENSTKIREELENPNTSR